MEGLSRIEQDREMIEQHRMFAEQNAWSNEEEIAEQIDGGEMSGTIHDINGKTVGKFQYKE